MLIVHAKLPILPEKREEFLGAVTGLIEASNAEEGVLSYRLFESVDTPNEFLMFEHYVDDAALTTHLQSPHFQAAGGALGGWLSGPPSVTKHEAGEGVDVPLG
ncbi:Putative monooxygenase YcnE [Paraconexibacter sp. AEG42_29]|uniref:Monooxygenase YcnE n=1 Tax=Paraconexibacter sp. AEG42_29 TaxID=2997339 RepID=A0AAU7AYC0_9ACTN